MRLTDRVEQVVIAAIERHAALADCEIDHQVQIIHLQTRPGAPPQARPWISLSVRSLAIGEWLFHDPITTPDLHPDPQELTMTIRQALANLAAARAEQIKASFPLKPVLAPSALTTRLFMAGS